MMQSCERETYVNGTLVTYLVELIFTLLWVVDGRLVAVVEEMASCDEAIAAIVTGSACYEDAFALAEGL